MLIYYVYAYMRKDNTPYYIGKGKGTRAFEQHRINGKGVHTPTRERIVFLETNLTNTGAMALERRYIRWYGRRDLNTGILHNRTDGGEGTSGIIRKVSEATKERQRESALKRFNPKRGSRKKPVNYNPFKGAAGSEMSKRINAERMANGTHQNQQHHKCPHCGLNGKGPIMFRYHFDKCKLNPDRVQ